MTKTIFTLLLLFIGTSQAIAVTSISTPTTYIEDFEAPFPTWESNWLGTHSNLGNYHGSGATGKQGSGGLWIDDADGVRGFDTVEINFTPSFGATLAIFEIDITTYIPDVTIQVFDISGASIFNSAVSLTGGATYERFTATSSNGISGFKLFAPIHQIEGNTGIDNVRVSTVPVPSAIWFLVSGILGLSAFRKKSI